MKKIKFCLLVLCVMPLIGCGGTRTYMALQSKTTEVSLQQDSMVLYTMSTNNFVRPNFKPWLEGAFVWSVDLDKTEKYFVIHDEKSRAKRSDFGSDYLVSAMLPPGKYKIRDMFGKGYSIRQSRYLSTVAEFSVPLYSEFELGRNEIAYIGHIQANIHPREGDHQLRAGPLLPLLPQNTAGFSNGTFKVKISDQYERDVAHFKRKFPIIEDFNVVNRVMDQWTQPTKADMK